MIRSASPDAVLIAAPLRIVIHKAQGGGYWAEVPAFPGVYAEGETLAEVRREAEATLARYFEERERRASEAAEGRTLADEDGPIPLIPDRGDDLGVCLPLPDRVKAARAVAAARTERALEHLPDDPAGSEEALLATFDDRTSCVPSVAGRANGG